MIGVKLYGDVDEFERARVQRIEELRSEVPTVRAASELEQARARIAELETEIATLRPDAERWRSLVAASGGSVACHALAAVSQARQDAEAFGPRFASLHEAYAVLLEEVEEVWAIVRQRQDRRDLAKLAREATQVAAVALRIAAQVKT